MKIKNKICFLILTFIMSMSFATPVYSNGCNDGYHYFSFGAGPIVFIPNAGIGYRERHSKYGWDVSLSFSTIGYVHQFTADAVRHYYLHPTQQNSPYFGIGIMGSGVITNTREGACTLSPDFIFGKELKTYDRRQFLEMHVAVPTLWIDPIQGLTIPCPLPLTYIKYGLAF